MKPESKYHMCGMVWEIHEKPVTKTSIAEKNRVKIKGHSLHFRTREN